MTLRAAKYRSSSAEETAGAKSNRPDQLMAVTTLSLESSRCGAHRR
eukprot:CAMPEP_0202843872 /NCGR_PEP_ID=MMETSP1389-20130828/65717_1 /ASSEMBLY_ACC=CAM_ASM_000865 /TAXON_ID=302021 /ORGANISM="Rhodomonas sp., Strain CCMP768" /LENGTH=45 /DNA_ID= /DNA_START= /DNA_END= /DNA_ORIENTATION=